MLKCRECGKDVRIPKHRWSKFEFCSRQCLYRWHANNDRVTLTCSICDLEFSVMRFRSSTAKYCSRKCYYASLRGRGSVALTCVVCGKSFNRPPSRAIYASPVCDKTCRGLLMRKEQPTVKGYRVWMKRRGVVEKCGRCGFDAIPDILVVHHHDHNRSNNKPDNLEVLCPNCHAIEHYAQAEVVSA